MMKQKRGRIPFKLPGDENKLAGGILKVQALKPTRGGRKSEKASVFPGTLCLWMEASTEVGVIILSICGAVFAM